MRGETCAARQKKRETRYPAVEAQRSPIDLARYLSQSYILGDNGSCLFTGQISRPYSNQIGVLTPRFPLHSAPNSPNRLVCHCLHRRHHAVAVRNFCTISFCPASCSPARPLSRRSAVKRLPACLLAVLPHR